MLNLAMVLLALSTAQAPCPHLTGDYVIQSDDGRVHVSIQQTACTRISIAWTSSLMPAAARVPHVLTLNGVFHADSGWFGATEAQQAAARFQGGSLEILEKPAGAT